jgi:hypothetical protein
MGILEKLLGQVSIVRGVCAEPGADQAPIAGMRIANNSGEALLCSPARRRFAIATRINRFMICPPSVEGDAWVATDWRRSAAAEFTHDASNSHRANCRHWCVGGTLVPVQPPLHSIPGQEFLRNQPCGDRKCPAIPAPLVPATEWRAMRSTTSPLRRRTSAWIYEGKKRPRLNPPPARWRRPVGAVLGM